MEVNKKVILCVSLFVYILQNCFWQVLPYNECSAVRGILKQPSLKIKKGKQLLINYQIKRIKKEKIKSKVRYYRKAFIIIIRQF